MKDSLIFIHRSSFIVHHLSFMSEPEIARRCIKCGAAVRGRARFCPQCGQAMSEAPTLNYPAAVEARPASSNGGLVDEAERIAHELNEKVSPVVESAAPRSDNHTGAAAQVEPARADVTAADARAEVSAAVEPAVRHEVGAAAEHDAAQAERAGGVRGRAGERVERLREASFVVFDEAQDDPTLRFVLVAAVCFILFLLILVLSRVLG